MGEQFESSASDILTQPRWTPEDDRDQENGNFCSQSEEEESGKPTTPPWTPRFLIHSDPKPQQSPSFNSSLPGPRMDSTVDCATSQDRPAPSETFAVLSVERNHPQQASKSSDFEAKPWNCDKCPASFGTDRKLGQHKRRVHRQMRFPCSICSQSFGRKDNLSSHERTHSGEKPFACPNCPAAFALKAKLQRHISSVHLKLRPFKCPRCPSFVLSETGSHQARLHCPSQAASLPMLLLRPLGGSCCRPQASPSSYAHHVIQAQGQGPIFADGGRARP